MKDDFKSIYVPNNGTVYLEKKLRYKYLFFQDINICYLLLVLPPSIFSCFLQERAWLVAQLELQSLSIIFFHPWF